MISGIRKDRKVSPYDLIEQFESDLHSAHDDPAAIRSLFAAHVRSEFLSEFVRIEVENIMLNPDHVVRKNAGQVSFTPIHNAAFDYTIRLSHPFDGRPHPVRWIGERQIMSVKGSGDVTVRILTVPCDINRFETGVRIEDVETVILQPGSFLESASPHTILDIYEVKAPVILEVLTIHDESVELHWTFDEQLRSAFVESARMTCSRLQNVLELAARMGSPVPDSVYKVVLSEGNTQAKLLAIQSLLMTDSAAGFEELQRAIDGDDAALSNGAQLLFDTLMARG